MSELEKKQRAEYQLKRKRIIWLQAIIIAVLTVSLLVSSLIYLKMDSDTYVSYTEDGSVIYKAYLNDNEFYDEEYLNGSHAYIAELVNKMTADFAYELNMNTTGVEYKYSYKIDAQLEIKDNKTSMVIYNPIDELKPLCSAVVRNNKLTMNDSVEIDYNHYNNIAKSFIATYDLKDVSACLKVVLHIDVVGKSESFAENNEGVYNVELRVPLIETTVTPAVYTSVPDGEQKILAVNNNNKAVLQVLSIVLLALDAIAGIVMALYIILTRDKHIDYSRRVKRLLSSYRSYIQEIKNEFDFEGRQVLSVKTFEELLEIRDTLRIPILMYENEDKTCSQFIIATSSNLIYLFEVKVAEE